MPLIKEDDDQEQAQQQGQDQQQAPAYGTPAAAPTGGGAATGGTGAARKPTSSSPGGFTDFGKYAKANVGNLGAQASKVTEGLTGKFKGAAEGLRQEGVAYRAGLQGRRLGNTWEGKTLSNVDQAQFGRALSQQDLTGGFASAKGYGATKAAEADIAATETFAGKQKALRNLVSQGGTGGAGTYSRGESLFDAALLGRDKESAQQLRDTRQQYAGRSGELLQAQKSESGAEMQSINRANQARKAEALSWLEARRADLQDKRQKAELANKAARIQGFEQDLNRAASEGYAVDRTYAGGGQPLGEFVGADQAAIDAQFGGRQAALQALARRTGNAGGYRIEPTLSDAAGADERINAMLADAQTQRQAGIANTYAVPEGGPRLAGRKKDPRTPNPLDMVLDATTSAVPGAFDRMGNKLNPIPNTKGPKW